MAGLLIFTLKRNGSQPLALFSGCGKVLELLVVDEIDLEGVFAPGMFIVLSTMLRVLSDCHPNKVDE